MTMKCFLNGIVHTVNPLLPRAEAVVTQGTRIIFVGTSSGARKFAGEGAEVIDLQGRLMLPGFIDDHVHFVLGGTQVGGLKLRGCTSTAAFVGGVGAYVRSHRGAWVTGGDWDQEAWETKTLPRKEWIDPVSADTPVFLPRFDWHMALANSVALKRAGITRDTPDPPGGRIERDPTTGEPTGIVKDAAMDLVLGVIPKPAAHDLELAVLKALGEARRAGVTSVHDVAEEAHIPVYKKLEGDGKLTCRIYARLPLAGYRKLLREGARHASGDELVKVGSMKAFADGSLGSNTAWFFEPYLNEPTTGLAMEALTSGLLRTQAMDADRHRLQLSIHAIGDRANDAVLDIFEEIVRTNPPWDRRLRIEHAQHVRRADVARFAALGVIVSAQPYHCIDDGVWAETRIGAERAACTYAFKTFLEAGVRVCFGSDWTVAPLNPIPGIYAAVTRATLDGKRPGGWTPAERLTVEEAVRCYTINNAYASFEEGLKGSIEAGKLADMVVLSENIFTVPPGAIKDVRVEMTVIGGEPLKTIS
jgi:hypothetical protein